MITLTQIIIFSIVFPVVATAFGLFIYYLASLYDKEHQDDRLISTTHYLPGLEISLSHSLYNPNNCSVIERTADGESVGPCWYYLKDGVCPRHGRVKQ